MLRDALEEVSANETPSPEVHIRLVLDLRDRFQHSISPLESEEPLHMYTCLMYVFGFHRSATYKAIASTPPYQTFAGADFAAYLLGSDLLPEPPPQSSDQEALIFYLAEDQKFLHAGIELQSGRIRSKWGSRGLYEHELFEVPSGYGNHVLRKARIPDTVALDIFQTYAAQRSRLDAEGET